MRWPFPTVVRRVPTRFTRFLSVQYLLRTSIVRVESNLDAQPQSSDSWEASDSNEKIRISCPSDNAGASVYTPHLSNLSSPSLFSLVCQYDIAL